MNRPLEFRESYVVIRNLPYEMHGPNASGGVLSKGCCVWMQPSPRKAPARDVPVYAEDLGIIWLDPRHLSRRD